jgi:hypothetical protein
MLIKMTNLTDFIKNPLSDFGIQYRVHATRRMFRRNIHEDDIDIVLKNGEIIEQYEEDFPLPSLLINGRTSAGRPLHLVVAVNFPEMELIVITAYEPDPRRWTENFSRRL